MSSIEGTEGALEQGVIGSQEAVQEAGVGADRPQEFAPKDIRHNMIVLVMLEAIFNTGASDLALVTAPLYVYLNASNVIAGLSQSLAWISLIGVFISPFISVRCRVKKWYLLVSHIPYIGTWGLTGLGIILYKQLGLSTETLLSFVIALVVANLFFGGFVGLPHQEYVAACIPMSHRGRYNGYSLSLGAATSMVSTLIGGLILKYVARPISYGFLYVLAWFFCQSGYTMALLGRERPTPIEKSPHPWSRAMLKAFWEDKGFVRVILLYHSFNMFFIPAFTVYLGMYALRELKLPDQTAAIIAFIMLVARFSTSAILGQITDKFSPKRVIPFYPLFGLLAMSPIFLLHNQWGVYAAAALTTIFMTGYQNAFGTLTYGIPKPENRAGHFTMQLITNYAILSLGALVGGLMFDKFSYIPTYTIIAIYMILLAPIAKYYLSILSADPKAYS